LRLTGAPGQRKSFLFSTDLSKTTIFVLLLNKPHERSPTPGYSGRHGVRRADPFGGIWGANAAQYNRHYPFSQIWGGDIFFGYSLVCDQLAMARLACATFALLLALLPAGAAVIGVVVLRQTPTVIEVIGILLDELCRST